MESTMKKNVWWRRLGKRLTGMFRKKRSPTANVEMSEQTSTVIEEPADASFASGEDGTSYGTETSATVYERSELGDENPTMFTEEMAELKAARLGFLYAKSRLKNKKIVAKMCDAEQEICRLNVTICELQDRLAESEAKEKNLQDCHRTSQAVHREQAAKIDELTAENGTLRDALSVSTRQTNSTVWAVKRAESILDEAGQRAAEAVQSAARAAARAAEQRPVLSSAVDDLQSVLMSPVAELRIDVLQTVIGKLQLLLA